MSQFQKILLFSFIFMLPVSIYMGQVMAWLFGHFLPGLNETNSSPTALLFWKIGMIVVVLIPGCFMLAGIIYFFVPRK